MLDFNFISFLFFFILMKYFCNILPIAIINDLVQHLLGVAFASVAVNDFA